MPVAAKYKPSKALQRFDRTFIRSAHLVKIFVEIEKLDEPITPHAGDLIRASIVFSVSAMDAYFTDRFCESLVPFIKKRGPTSGLVDMLQSAGLNTEQALIMLSMQKPYRRVRNLVQGHLARHVTQNFAVIDKLFLGYGLKNFCENVQGTTGKKSMLRYIEKLVERRHQIVHEGDINQHNRIRAVVTSATFRRLNCLKEFVHASDKFLFNTLR